MYGRNIFIADLWFMGFLELHFDPYVTSVSFQSSWIKLKRVFDLISLSNCLKALKRVNFDVCDLAANFVAAVFNFPHLY